MTAPVGEDDLHAYLDGELSPVRRRVVEDWLAEHPDARERLRLWRVQADGLHALFDPVLEEPVPERLRAAAMTPRRRLAPALPRVAAALLLLLVGGVGGWLLRGAGLPAQRSAAGLAAEALSAHVIYAAEVRHPVEVPASEQAHLVAWLSKRLGAPLRIPDLAPAGFALVGGRLLPAAEGPAAQFMYENAGGQRLTLYLRHNPGTDITAFRYAAQRGADAFYWLDGPFGYALVAALPRDQLMPLARAVYQQLEKSD